MGYLLLWIESLAAALFLIAIVATGDFKSRLTKWLCAGFWLTVPIGLVGFEAFAAYIVSTSTFNWYVINTVSWLVCFIGASAYILRIFTKNVQSHRQYFTGLFVSIALFVITFWNMDSSVRLKLSSVRLEASAMGLSAAPPRPLDDDNAALVYEDAFKLLDGLNKDTEPAVHSKIIEHLGKPEFNTRNPELQEFLKKRQSIIALLKRATAMRGCFFEHDYSKLSVDMSLPELGNMRSCARLLAMDAQYKAADGHIKEALEDIRDIRTMARHVGSEPTLISGLVSVAIDSLASETLETLLTTGELPTGDDLRSLSNPSMHSFQRTMNRCLSGEEALGLSVFGLMGSAEQMELLQFTGMNSLANEISLPFWRVYMLQDDLEAYRSLMEKLRKYSQEDFAQQKKDLDSLEKETKDRTVGRIMTSLLLPAVTRSIVSFTKADAKMRLANLALAMAAYHAKKNQFPDSLDQLVPDYISNIPLDPFDDKNSLRYIAGKDSVTLYSVGPNQKDDSGKASKTDDGDIVFHLGKTSEKP